MRAAIFLQILKTFWLCWRITSVSYRMHSGWRVLGRQKYR
jgi:hypothetical protein